MNLWEENGLIYQNHSTVDVVKAFQNQRLKILQPRFELHNFNYDRQNIVMNRQRRSPNILTKKYVGSLAYLSLRLESPKGFDSLAYPDIFCDFNFFATFAA